MFELLRAAALAIVDALHLLKPPAVVAAPLCGKEAVLVSVTVRNV